MGDVSFGWLPRSGDEADDARYGKIRRQSPSRRATVDRGEERSELEVADANGSSVVGREREDDDERRVVCAISKQIRCTQRRAACVRPMSNNGQRKAERGGLSIDDGNGQSCNGMVLKVSSCSVSQSTVLLPPTYGSFLSNPIEH